MDALNQPNRAHNSKVVAGIILLSVGVILLLSQFTFFYFPGWIFSWPMILIVIGLYSGAKHNFRNSSSLILIGIGVVFLLNRIFYIGHIIWPIGLIAFGAYLLTRRSHRLY